MIQKDEADSKVKSGWIRAWMIFEVLAVKEDVTRKSLETLIGKLERDTRVRVYRNSYGEFKKVDNPIKGVECGYSLTCEVEMVAQNLDCLAQIVMEYGPSAIELLEPSKISMEIGEAQSMLNSVSHIMHQFAAAGMGGMVFVRGD